MRPVRSATLSAIAIATLFGALGAGAGAGCIDAGGGPPDDPGEPTGPVDPGGPVKPDPTDAGTSPDQPGEPTVPPDLSTGCPVQGTSPMMSLAVTDAAVLARFSFARTVAQLRATAAVPGSQTTRMLWRDWMRSFGASSAPGDCDDVDVNHYGLRCPRPAEAKLANIDPLAAGAAVRFVPVGLFNRFDLAPATGSNCGEFRIVYAMQSQDPTITGRAFLIFEGALPNPTPAAGLAACLPVARFWQALSADGDPASRAAKLERFFYLGTAVPGFGAVVRASNYGLANGATALHGAGQIRGNFFVDNAEWHLREYRLRRTCDVASDPSTCKLAAELVPAKANPADELFRGTHPLSASFQAAFVAQVPRLVGTSVTSLGMTFADGFDELESVSQTTPAPAPVRYDVNASAAIRAAVTARLGQLGSSLTSSQVLARATTQTCAGCHQVANNLGLGGGLRWPTSLQFVHIDENRRLSPALTGTFLPHRLQVLEGFINARCTAPGQTARQAVAAVADGFTVGGSPIGAAN
ncbi:MAG TPA: hypothetical protein VHE35_28170 [Kofleriaceae bacterium]|nr:hypothetical protein [Kofleriaceae bacterium]